MDNETTCTPPEPDIPLDNSALQDLTLTPEAQAMKDAYEQWKRPPGRIAVRPTGLAQIHCKKDAPAPVYTASLTTMPKGAAPELNRKSRRMLAGMRRKTK